MELLSNIKEEFHNKVLEVSKDIEQLEKDIQDVLRLNTSDASTFKKAYPIATAIMCNYYNLKNFNIKDNLQNSKKVLISELEKFKPSAISQLYVTEYDETRSGRVGIVIMIYTEGEKLIQISKGL